MSTELSTRFKGVFVSFVLSTSRPSKSISSQNPKILDVSEYQILVVLKKVVIEKGDLLILVVILASLSARSELVKFHNEAVRHIKPSKLALIPVEDKTKKKKKKAIIFSKTWCSYGIFLVFTTCWFVLPCFLAGGHTHTHNVGGGVVAPGG